MRYTSLLQPAYGTDLSSFHQAEYSRRLFDAATSVSCIMRFGFTDAWASYGVRAHRAKAMDDMAGKEAETEKGIEMKSLVSLPALIISM